MSDGLHGKREVALHMLRAWAGSAEKKTLTAEDICDTYAEFWYFVNDLEAKESMRRFMEKLA